MKPDEEAKQKRARLELMRKQARTDPVCADALALEASLSKQGGGAAFIPTMLDYDDDTEDWRPF